MVQVGTLLKTQLAALEGRLFLAKPVRPPLAADRRRTAAASGIMAETPATTLVAPANPGSKRNQGPKKVKGQKTAKKALQPAPVESRPLPPAPTELNEG